MKKSILFIAAAALLVACTTTPKQVSAPFVELSEAEYEAKATEFSEAQNALMQDSTLTEEQYLVFLKEYYTKNQDNILGAEIFNKAVYYLSLDEMKEMLENATDTIKNNPRVQRYLSAKENELKTAPGTQFIDFPATTVDINNPEADGLDTSLGAIVAQGKPVLVDFWASWCGPCRRAISNELSVLAPEYMDRVNFVGVAVWEDEGVEATKKAMAALPISWPIIFAGGRGEGPTDDYGIMGIPHIMLIGVDGIIKARHLSGEGIKEAIEAELAK